MISDRRAVLPLLLVSLPLWGACTGPGTLDDDDSDATGTTGQEPPASTSSSSEGSSTAAVDPDGGSTSTTTTGVDESSGTTGEGLDDPGCPECMVLADGLMGGRGIATDLDAVYFTDQVDGSVHRVRKGGGDGGLVAADQDEPYDIAVAGDQIYWTNFALGGGVYHAPIDGGPAVVLEADDYARCLAVAGDQIFWGTFDQSDGHVMQRSLVGVEPATLLADLLGGVADMVAEDGQVFFTAHTTSAGGGFIERPPMGPAEGSVYEASMGADPFFPNRLITDLAEPWGIAKQGDTLVWVHGMGMAAAEPLRVLSMPSAGGPSQTLASGQTAPWGVAVDEQYVYWTDHDTVRAVPLAGGDEVVLAELQNQARSITVDDQWVFWITRDRVLQRPKP